MSERIREIKKLNRKEKKILKQLRILYEIEKECRYWTVSDGHFYRRASTLENLEKIIRKYEDDNHRAMLSHFGTPGHEHTRSSGIKQYLHYGE